MKARRSKERQASRRRLYAALVFATLGTVAVFGVVFSIGGFQTLEPILLLIPVGFGALGFRQTVVRGLLTAVIVYVATGVAAMLHLTTAPYFGAYFGNVVTNSVRAVSFAVLSIAVWIVLEVVSRYLIPSPGLPRLGGLDTMGSFVIYIALGVMVASIAFNTIGFSGRWKRAHDAALLRSTFNRVFSLHYTAQSVWLPGGPPQLYAYDVE
jgi:hypothetical protein